MKHKWRLVLRLGVLIFVGLTGWFVLDWQRGRVEGNAMQAGVGGLVGGALMGVIGSAVLSFGTLAAVLVANKLFKILARTVLLVSLLVWMPILALWQTAVVTGKLLLLVPLFVLFIGTRLTQLWWGIFFTCPSRRCSYRGLPAHVCPNPECQASHYGLWPSLYGVLWHVCAQCGERLPTLDWLGRDKLARRCGQPSCQMQLLGRHAGRAPERLVAIAGGTNTGKTSYLLMTVREITHSGDAATTIKAVIDDPSQEAEFQRNWDNLAAGLPAAKTTDVALAFMLYGRVGRERCQLFLYDAPGEEFDALGATAPQQYFPLLEGVVLLVDPESFAAQQTKADRNRSQTNALLEIVASVVRMTSAGNLGSAKIQKRVAVVISKADLAFVTSEIGDVRQAPIPSEVCRTALMQWGGENALRALEQRFASVRYFACSPLGRAVDNRSREPFNGSGVSEPVEWLLSAHPLTHRGEEASVSSAGSH
ncbi:MAG: hypothetical protein L0Y58_03110 [Verrucomicrobia subdivision 3 bacterium]|nr:hypothetical protein [Limisphaerales bacterium]